MPIYSAALNYHVNPGAIHNFGDPRKAGEADRESREDAKVRAADFIRGHVT